MDAHSKVERWSNAALASQQQLSDTVAAVFDGSLPQPHVKQNSTVSDADAMDVLEQWKEYWRRIRKQVHLTECVFSPAILCRITDFLPISSLAPLMRVSPAFYNTYGPIIYRSIELESGTLSPYDVLGPHSLPRVRTKAELLNLTQRLEIWDHIDESPLCGDTYDDEDDGEHSVPQKTYEVFQPSMRGLRTLQLHYRPVKSIDLDSHFNAQIKTLIYVFFEFDSFPQSTLLPSACSCHIPIHRATGPERLIALLECIPEAAIEREEVAERCICQIGGSVKSVTVIFKPDMWSDAILSSHSSSSDESVSPLGLSEEAVALLWILEEFCAIPDVEITIVGLEGSPVDWRPYCIRHTARPEDIVAEFRHYVLSSRWQRQEPDNANEFYGHFERVRFVTLRRYIDEDLDDMEIPRKLAESWIVNYDKEGEIQHLTDLFNTTPSELSFVA